MKKLPWIWVVERTDIPKWLATDIGRVAVEWSYLEFQTQEIIRLLMATNVKFARIITTGMSLRTRLQNTSHLLHAYVYNEDIDKSLIDGFSHITYYINNQIEPDRNYLIHGTWAKVEGKWILIRSARGSRGHSQLGKFKLPRSVLPELKPWTHEKTEELRAKIQKAHTDLDTFTTNLETALPPSSHKSPRQRKQDRPSRARKTTSP